MASKFKSEAPIAEEKEAGPKEAEKETTSLVV